MRVFRVFTLLMSVFVFTENRAVAAVITVDFEGLDAMPSFFAGVSVPNGGERLSDQLHSSHGLVFSSSGGYVPVVTLGAGHATSGTQGIGGSTSSDLLTYDGTDPIEIFFFDPGNINNKATTDFVSIRGDLAGGGSDLFMNAYDLVGNLITSVSASAISGALLSVSSVGIHSVQIIGNGSTAFDDLSFDDDFDIVAAVPIPGTVMLYLSILGGVAIRRPFLGRNRIALTGFQRPRAHARHRWMD